MKKLIITIGLSVFLVSCGSPVELTQEYIDTQYKIEDRSINLQDQKLSGFVSLNEFKTETEVNNIYLGNNSIDMINVTQFDDLGKIDMSNNNIRFISDLRLPEKVRHIDVSGNNLDSLQGLDKYTEIKTLNISNNNLENEDLLAITTLDKLIFIKAEGNNFSETERNKIAEINSRFLTNNTDPFIKK